MRARIAAGGREVELETRDPAYPLSELRKQALQLWRDIDQAAPGPEIPLGFVAQGMLPACELSTDPS